MSVVLYLLGVGLFGWSAYLMLAGETYAAIDIAANLAGWGAFAIGLGAIVGALGKLTRTIAANADQRGEKTETKSAAAESRRGPPEPKRGEPAAIEPKVVEPKAVEAKALESKINVAEPKAAPLSRRPLKLPSIEEADASFDRPKVVRPPSGASQAEPASAEEAPPAPERRTRPPFAPGDEYGRRRSSPPPVALKVARPRVERAPAVMAATQFEDRGAAPVPIIPLRHEPEPTIEREPESGPAPEPLVAQDPVPEIEAAPEVAQAEAPPTVAEPEPVLELAPEPAPKPTPEPVAQEPAPESDPAPEPTPLAELEPLPEAEPEQAPEDARASAPAVPEWLARARARREARIDGPSVAPAFTPPAEQSLRDRLTRREPAAQQPPAEQPAASSSAPKLTSEGEHKGVLYRFYDDQSVEAVSPHGTRRFSSIEEFRSTVIAARGREDFDEEAAQLEAGSAGDTTPEDPLDAALAALEDGGDGSSLRDRIGRTNVG